MVENFLGIRYALEPLGAQRFKPPADVSMTKSTFDASEFGPMCIQVSDNMDPNESEDCLYLNVVRPAGTSSGQKLPVVVHFHGGSFVSGSGASRGMATMVSWSSEPIIGVSVNFRLGALGFLSSGLMSRVGALNLGLQDQLAALKWVKQNIDGFGGDPSKVTIMGDSAGAHSVSISVPSVTLDITNRPRLATTCKAQPAKDYSPKLSWNPVPPQQGSASPQLLHLTRSNSRPSRMLSELTLPQSQITL